MNDIIEQFKNEFSINPLGLIGVIILTLGVLIIAFGRTFFLFRWILGDRSMIAQIIIGVILSIIGIILLFISL